MIVLFTDFGPTGPYMGQMKTVLYSQAPHTPVIDLFCDAPSCKPKASAYLLAAYVHEFPPGSVFLCVVDPGVGGERLPLMLKADGRWFVGPGNGLFNMIARHAKQVDCWKIIWRPEQMSASFHGRDLFAPVAARLAREDKVPGERTIFDQEDKESWPDDLFELIYIDYFGNMMTGICASNLSAEDELKLGKISVKHARTFSDVQKGEVFWYENSNGLVEVAINQGNAARQFGLSVGMEVRLA
ncbi:MAG: S-adenosyl-l-methionine hydroxide adenosyltransferase family protein [Mariprofundaceae bacterium]